MQEQQFATFQLQTSNRLVVQELCLQCLFIVTQFTLKIIFNPTDFVVFLVLRSCWWTEDFLESTRGQKTPSDRRRPTLFNVSFLILYCLVCSCWKRFNSSSKSVCWSRSNFLRWFWLYFIRSDSSLRCFSRRRVFSMFTCSWNWWYSRSNFERRSTLSPRHRSSN